MCFHGFNSASECFVSLSTFTPPPRPKTKHAPLSLSTRIVLLSLSLPLSCRPIRYPTASSHSFPNKTPSFASRAEMLSSREREPKCARSFCLGVLVKTTASCSQPRAQRAHCDTLWCIMRLMCGKEKRLLVACLSCWVSPPRRHTRGTLRCCKRIWEGDRGWAAWIAKLYCVLGCV